MDSSSAISHLSGNGTLLQLQLPTKPISSQHMNHSSQVELNQPENQYDHDSNQIQTTIIIPQNSIPAFTTDVNQLMNHYNENSLQSSQMDMHQQQIQQQHVHHHHQNIQQQHQSQLHQQQQHYQMHQSHQQNQQYIPVHIQLSNDQQSNMLNNQISSINCPTDSITYDHLTNTNTINASPNTIYFDNRQNLWCSTNTNEIQANCVNDPSNSGSCIGCTHHNHHHHHHCHNQLINNNMSTSSYSPIILQNQQAIALNCQTYNNSIGNKILTVNPTQTTSVAPTAVVTPSTAAAYSLLSEDKIYLDYNNNNNNLNNNTISTTSTSSSSTTNNNNLTNTLTYTLVNAGQQSANSEIITNSITNTSNIRITDNNINRQTQIHLLTEGSFTLLHLII